MPYLELILGGTITTLNEEKRWRPCTQNTRATQPALSCQIEIKYKVFGDNSEVSTKVTKCPCAFFLSDVVYKLELVRYHS